MVELESGFAVLQNEIQVLVQFFAIIKLKKPVHNSPVAASIFETLVSEWRCIWTLKISSWFASTLTLQSTAMIFQFIICLSSVQKKQLRFKFLKPIVLFQSWIFVYDIASNRNIISLYKDLMDEKENDL